MSGVSLHLRVCLSASIMASPDAEVKCPYKDDEYECNVPLPEREIRQVRVTPVWECEMTTFDPPFLDTGGDSRAAAGAVQAWAAAGRECSCQQLPLPHRQLRGLLFLRG